MPDRRTSRTCFGDRKSLAPSRRTRVGTKPPRMTRTVGQCVRPPESFCWALSTYERPALPTPWKCWPVHSKTGSLPANPLFLSARLRRSSPAMGPQLPRDLDNLVARASEEHHWLERELLRPRRARDLPGSNCRFAASLGTYPSFFPRSQLVL
jgi:hypothetical protein